MGRVRIRVSVRVRVRACVCAPERAVVAGRCMWTTVVERVRERRVAWGGASFFVLRSGALVCVPVGCVAFRPGV